MGEQCFKDYHLKAEFSSLISHSAPPDLDIINGSTLLHDWFIFQDLFLSLSLFHCSLFSRVRLLPVLAKPCPSLFPHLSFDQLISLLTLFFSSLLNKIAAIIQAQVKCYLHLESKAEQMPGHDVLKHTPRGHPLPGACALPPVRSFLSQACLSGDCELFQDADCLHLISTSSFRIVQCRAYCGAGHINRCFIPVEFNS